MKIPGVSKPVFMFQGVVSNLRSQPVLVNWFGVQAESVVTTEQLHELLSPGHPNPRQAVDEKMLKQKLLDSIEIARTHMEATRVQRGQELTKLMKPEFRRVKLWEQKKRAQFAALSDGTSLQPAMRKKLEREKAEVEKRLEARQRWFEEGMRTSQNIYLRVVGVLV